MSGVVNPIKGTIAQGIDFINGHVIDGIVNGVGYATAVVGRVVYRQLDQRGIDLIINAAAGGTSGAGGKLRRLQSGRVQQYAGGFVLGALLLVIGLVIFT